MSIAAALLHDVVEDQDFSIDDIRKEFGEEIAALVDGVTKLALADFEVIEDDPRRSRRTLRRRSGPSSGAARRTCERYSWRWRAT